MFFRSSKRPEGRHLSRPLVWTLLSVIYVGYPAGCILRLVATGSPGWNLVGLILIGLALIAFLVLAGSSLQRLAQEQPERLDERELMQRNRAAYRAYGSLSGIALVACIYMSLQPDLEKKIAALWIPTTYDHWNAVFWGAFILVTTLPTAFLSTEGDPADGE